PPAPRFTLFPYTTLFRSRSFEGGDSTALCIVNINLVANLPNDAGGGEFGVDGDGRLVIDEVSVDDGFAVAVGENGFAEDVGGVRSEEHTSELQSRRDLVC